MTTTLVPAAFSAGGRGDHPQQVGAAGSGDHRLGEARGRAEPGLRHRPPAAPVRSCTDTRPRAWPGYTRPVSRTPPPARIRAAPATRRTRWRTAMRRVAVTEGAAWNRTRYTVFRSGAVTQDTAPARPVVSVRTAWKTRCPARRAETSTRAPTTGAPLLVPAKRTVARWPGQDRRRATAHEPQGGRVAERNGERPEAVAHVARAVARVPPDGVRAVGQVGGGHIRRRGAGDGHLVPVHTCVELAEPARAGIDAERHRAAPVCGRADRLEAEGNRGVGVDPQDKGCHGRLAAGIGDGDREGVGAVTERGRDRLEVVGVRRAAGMHSGPAGDDIGVERRGRVRQPRRRDARTGIGGGHREGLGLSLVVPAPVGQPPRQSHGGRGVVGQAGGEGGDPDGVVRFHRVVARQGRSSGTRPRSGSPPGSSTRPIRRPWPGEAAARTGTTRCAAAPSCRPTCRSRQSCR